MKPELKILPKNPSLKEAKDFIEFLTGKAMTAEEVAELKEVLATTS